MKEKTFHKGIMISLTIVMILLLYGIAMMIVPVKTMEVFNNPIIVLNDNKTVGGGGEKYLRMEIDYCLYTDAPITLTRQAVDGIIFVFSTDAIVLPEGCHTVIIQEYITKGLPPGEYYMRYTYNFEFNKLRTETYTFKSEAFTVLE